MPRLNFWTIVAILTWLLLLGLLFVPVGSVLLSSFYDEAGNFTLVNYAKFLSEPRFHQAFLNTLVVGFGGLIGALLLGSIMAFCISRFVIEFFRGDDRGAILGMSTSQAVSIVIVPLAIVMLVRLRARSRA